MRAHPQQHHAQELQRALTDRLSRDAATTGISVNGAGSYWICHARRGRRQCDVLCSDRGGPEVLIVFMDAFAHQAWARTSSNDETVCAIDDWLSGATLQELHDRHPFVDRERRTLAALERRLLQLHPDLDHPRLHKVRSMTYDRYDLSFRVGNRSVWLHFENGEPVPRAWFSWDDIRMFDVSWSDTDKLADVIHRWIQERHTPSALHRDHPDIQLRPIARVYELGPPAEELEFCLSWQGVEDFYANDRSGVRDHALRLIAAVRRSGLDRALRAGTSVSNLLVSRSREHGLRPSQPFIAFLFAEMETVLRVHIQIDGERTLEFPTSQIDEERIMEELRRLASFPID